MYFFVLLLLIPVSIIFGAFEDVGWTARSKSLGNSIFAEFDGVNTMNYNPATISLARGIQGYISWDTPYAGLNDFTSVNYFQISGVIPFWNKFTIPAENDITKFLSRRGALGFTIRRFSVYGSEPDGSLIELYHEGTYSLIYAKDLNDVLFRGAKISAGIKLTLYDIGIGNSYEVQANTEMFSTDTPLLKISFGLDVGVTYGFSENLRLGIVLKNLIAPNVAILPDRNDYLPAELRLGGNWDLGDIFFLRKSKVGFGMITYGRDANDNRQTESSYNVGFEFKQFPAELLIKGKPFKGEMFAFRLGAIYLDKRVSEDVINITTGIGFNYVIEHQHQILVDYAFEYGINMGAFKHTIGLSYAYLLPNSAFEYKEDILRETEYMELLEKKKITNTNIIQMSTNTNIMIQSTNIIDINTNEKVTPQSLRRTTVPMKQTNENIPTTTTNTNIPPRGRQGGR